MCTWKHKLFAVCVAGGAAAAAYVIIADPLASFVSVEARRYIALILPATTFFALVVGLAWLSPPMSAARPVMSSPGDALWGFRSSLAPSSPMAGSARPEADLVPENALTDIVTAPLRTRARLRPRAPEREPVRRPPVILAPSLHPPRRLQERGSGT